MVNTYSAVFVSRFHAFSDNLLLICVYLKSYKVNIGLKETHTFQALTHYHFRAFFPSAITSIIYILNTKHNMKTSSVVKWKRCGDFRSFSIFILKFIWKSFKWIVVFFSLLPLKTTKTMKIQNLAPIIIDHPLSIRTQFPRKLNCHALERQRPTACSIEFI